MEGECRHEIVALDMKNAEEALSIPIGNLFKTRTCCIICGDTTIEYCVKVKNHDAYDLGLAYRSGPAKEALNKFLRKADQYYKEEKSNGLEP